MISPWLFMHMGAEGMKRAVNAGVDSVEHGYLYDR